jgi:peptidoglycan/xylan/chitin deacetylase (PgdA/CDA1 family)
VPRHIACLTFDFDAMSGMIAWGMTSPTPISRGEFSAVGVGRILALLAKYDIKATFFIPGMVIGTYPKVCERIVAAGHEVGHHGWTHVPPAKMNPDQEEAGLIRGCEAIRRLCGKNPRGYRSPAWDLSPATAELLIRHGFVYESSMMGNDHSPYQVRLGDVISADEPMQFGKEEWGVLTYTCHPYVIGRGHRMMMLERLIHGLMERGAVFMTMEAGAREYQGRRATV